MSLKFVNVSKKFGNKIILDQVSFEVHPGEILFILGRSGMGKSVTLKHFMGLLKPDSGEVWVDDLCVNQLMQLGQHGEDELPKVRQKCGMVFQHPALLDSLTAFENIAIGIQTPQYQDRIGKSLSPDEIKARVESKAALVHLNINTLSQKSSELSYGTQKRVSLARTLAPEPQYLLFDEPTTSLDPVSTQTINQLIYECSRALKVTSIVVSHDMNCALKIADRILVLDEAKILALGTRSEIIHHPAPLIQQFMAETLSLLTPEERSQL